jgi:chemotaxis protein methyltransferase CheR
MPAMTDDELALMNELLTSEMGLWFPDHKREILESRLGARIAELRLRSVLDYYVLLQQDAGNGRHEISALAEAVTNNESYFFRETYQFDVLFGNAAELKRGARGKVMRFLSAGCSSGEEPYTLNIYARENQYRMFGYDVAVDAFDISRARIEMCERGEYARSSLRGATAEQIEKYFLPIDDGYRLKPAFRKGVSFRIGNLLRDWSYGAVGTYDVIFCRNVLIYFSEEMIIAAADRFHRALREDGLLFLGHSESIIGLTRAFEPVRVGNGIAYRRNGAYRPR